MLTVIAGIEMFYPDLAAGFHLKFLSVVWHGCSPSRLPHHPPSTGHRSSKRLEKRPLPRATWVENSVKSELHDVLHYHPNYVVTPHETDDSPWKRRHEPVLATHQYRGDLGCDNCQEK